MRVSKEQEAKCMALADPKRSRLGGMPAVVADGPRKYRNEPVTFEGFTFDSKKELRRWLDLREQQRAGQIRDLRRQVAYPLVVNGMPVAEYVADFRYIRVDGPVALWVVEDVKSKATRKLPVYQLKKKLMVACHNIDVQGV